MSVVKSQRFFPVYLADLVQPKAYAVEKFISGRNLNGVAAEIIKQVRYPFKMGQPDDTHMYNCYSDPYKWCQKITLDYWQNAEETLTILVGDCEDSSIAFCSCARALGLKKDQVFEAFGIVTDLNDRVLGGHGWNYFKSNDSWRLYESTLDVPPSMYPVVSNIKEPFVLGNVKYKPELLWNDQWFEEITSYNMYLTLGGVLTSTLDTGRRKKKHKPRSNDVRVQGRNTKENIGKHRAIQEAWGKPSKVIAEYDKTSSKIKRAVGKVIRK